LTEEIDCPYNKLFHVKCREAGIRDWVQLPLKPGRAKNVQYSTRFRQI